jgi:hypothetical protein
MLRMVRKMNARRSAFGIIMERVDGVMLEDEMKGRVRK